MTSLNSPTIQARDIGKVLARTHFSSRLIVLHSSSSHFPNSSAAHSPPLMCLCPPKSFFLSLTVSEMVWDSLLLKISVHFMCGLSANGSLDESAAWLIQVAIGHFFAT
jgi:hypothetical protein